MQEPHEAYRVLEQRFCVEQTAHGFRLYRWLYMVMPSDDIATAITGSRYAWVRSVPVTLADCKGETLYMGAPTNTDRSVVELLERDEC